MICSVFLLLGVPPSHYYWMDENFLGDVDNQTKIDSVLLLTT